MHHQIGSYILSERVAVTDVGTVWRGYDRGGGGPVHVKVGEPRFAELRVSMQALRSVQEQQPLHQPGQLGVVSIRDCFLSDQGAAVLVTDHPQGRRVADAVAAYDGAYRQVAHFFREAAMILKAYHDVGMTHGDISPRTLWVDDSDLPVFAEFGMGVRQDALQSSEPPRQGDEGRERKFRLDQRADLFALGTVMYLLLSGETATEHPLAEMSSPHSVADDIAPIDRVALEAPTELRAICSQLLATDPVHRYLDADSLIRDLDAYLYGNRSRPSVKLAFVIVGALVVGLFGLWGVTGGGPSRIVDVKLLVARADGPKGEFERIATADHASYAGDALRLDIVLSKPANVVVIYRSPDGRAFMWDVATPSRSNQIAFSIPVNASSNGWRVPSPGGVGVLVVVSAADLAKIEALVELELMSVGEPPQTYNAITWRGGNLSRRSELNTSADTGARSRKQRGKSFPQYADLLIKNIQPSADDVAIGWLYVIGE
ncbi:MAG: hypothetical protein GXP29_15585 [Planctomycetes bacterium]|nr:hypothetical protein [Planctomycetota bacterium]